MELVENLIQKRKNEDTTNITTTKIPQDNTYESVTDIPKLTE